LGWGVIKHASTVLRQPNGPKAGLLWRPTDRQARFFAWWYAVDEDGRWLFDHGVRRLAKGSGKSPFAAVWALEELVGPVRLDGFDPRVPGGCVGKPVDMPWVQIAATAESQTANTMRMVRAMTLKRSRIVQEYGLDPGKTIIYTPTGGQLETITSSASAAEGAEITAAVEDETEHWTPTTGGKDLHDTIDRNLGKSASRSIETANAWVPGALTIAEESWDEWVAYKNGTATQQAMEHGKRTLYDAVIAPPTPNLRDVDAVKAAIAFVYEDCPWVDQRTILGRVMAPKARADVSRRFYLNQPTASEFAWTTPTKFAALAHPEIVVSPGDRIAMFFDGSKTRDATALVGCRIDDGHVFVIYSWEPTYGSRDEEVPAEQVDNAVRTAMATYKVAAFFADVREWEGYVKTTWRQEFADQLEMWAVPTGKAAEPIAWDMRSHSYEFAQAAELVHAEIDEQQFTHDGHRDYSDVLSRHVANARNHPYRDLVSISKETPNSPLKIDAAVCMVGARMARRLVLANGKPEKTYESYFR